MYTYTQLIFKDYDLCLLYCTRLLRPRQATQDNRLNESWHNEFKHMFKQARQQAGG